MYLRSLVTCHCRIWLAGLPGDVSEAVKALPVAQGLEPEFIVCDELPNNVQHKPACIIFALAPGRTKKAHDLGDEDTLLIGWCDTAAKATEADFQYLDDLWDMSSGISLAHRFHWAQERIWRRYHAWLIHNWWQTTLTMVPDLMWYKDINSIHLEINRALAETVEKTVEECRGQRHGYIWGLKPEEYEEGERVCLESDMKVVTSGKLMIGAEQVLDNGELRDLRTYKTPVFDKDGVIIGTAGVAQDITLLNRYHAKILDMAHKDELTGLSNRRYFYEYISEYRKNQTTCIFSIDLDHFKEINDTYGHKAGDDALKITGEVLRVAFPGSVVCRFGGDEFLVLLLGSISEDAAKNMAEMFLEKFRNRVRSDEHFSKLTASVGVAISHDMNHPIDSLVRESDLALYEAKDAGRDCVCTAWETHNN